MKVREKPGRADYSEGSKGNVFTSSREERDTVVSVSFSVLFLFFITVLLHSLNNQIVLWGLLLNPAAPHLPFPLPLEKLLKLFS